MVDSRYFFVTAIRKDEEHYFLLRAGPKSLKELSGHYNFNLVSRKSNGSRRYETVPNGSFQEYTIRFKVGKKNKVSPSKGYNKGLEFQLEEVPEDNLAKMKRKLRGKRLVYEHCKPESSNLRDHLKNGTDLV